jgi:hypothetical protein
MRILERNDALTAALRAFVGDAHFRAGIERALMREVIQNIEQSNPQ